MKFKALFASLFLFAAFAATTAQAQEVSADTLMKHIRNLSSSKYEGRLAGTHEYLMATEYVSSVLESYGVQPYEPSWMEYYFPIECNKVGRASFSTYVNAHDDQKDYVLGKDFVCAGMTGRGYADAPVVFCGYGIDNAIYDEYAKVDAKGKIVLVLTGVPRHVPQSITERYATLRDKARVARAHGAVGLVAINMSETCRPTEVQLNTYCGEPPHLATFPILQATNWCGGNLMADERMTLDSVLAMMEKLQAPMSFLLDKKFTIDIEASYNANAITGNIVGVLKGKDRRMSNEYIVVGAHLDHVGMQGNTCLFPGADDNASGVAALLETARLLSQSDWRQGRSVVFVLFSGGEIDHRGGQTFLQTFSGLSWIDAFVQIEGVGSGDSIAVMGGKQYPKLYGIASHNDSLYTQRMKANVKTAPINEAVAFDRIGIPSIGIYTTNGRRYNHVPSDMAENIDRRLVTQAATLLYHTVLQLCNGDYQGRSEQSRHIRFENLFEDIKIYSDGQSVNFKY